MRGYTTIEQSKKLTELGLNPETADMCYVGKEKFAMFLLPDETLQYGDTPCWSLSALLELMPNIEHLNTIWIPITFKKNKHYCVYESRSYVTPMYHAEGNSYVDAAFVMVCNLLENGYLKKGE